MRVGFFDGSPQRFSSGKQVKLSGVLVERCRAHSFS
jgi:hypothetical protein